MNQFKPFIGKNWFNEREAIDKVAAKLGLYTNLKVKHEDVADIDIDDKRVTVSIEQGGKIVSFKRG